MIDDGVAITLDRPRTLRLSLGALRRFEKATGQNALKLDWANMSATDATFLLWASLVHEDPELTVEQVENMVGRRDLLRVMTAMAEAWKLAAPEDEGGAAPGGEPNPTSTG